MSSNYKVAVVGGGLVGALEACLLAKRGFDVTLFEARHDGRNEPSYYGRSINLAISLRGISALKRLNLDHIVKEQAIPMKARMIHDRSGKSKPIPYDPDGRCINSIERAALNNFLLFQAEQEFKVKILFNHKLVDMNVEKGELMFRLRDDSEYNRQRLDESATASSPGTAETNVVVGGGGPELLKYKFDLILGCDGSRSSVRSILARQTQLELSQSYIEHGYLELRIDPNPDGSFKMEPNYLHIWPRGQYMMIALPNKDSSFTCTLFMPFAILDQIKQPREGLRFFEQNFPDSIELIGRQRVVDTLSKIGASSLISIKCKPYYYKDRVALLGDAAHAMVPFYGQGMNCGFEDCLTFDELLDKHLSGCTSDTDGAQPSKAATTTTTTAVAASKVMGQVLREYSERRCPNGHSMCDLAMYNYIEMRDLVNTWSFIMRKHLDNLLYRLFPSKWIPLYTMVTFSRIPVHECVQKRANQDKILERSFKFACLAVLGLSAIPLVLNYRSR